MSREDEEAWNVLLVRVRDLAVRGFWLARRCRENNGFGESVFSQEQYVSACGLCDELTAFLRRHGAVASPERPLANGKPAVQVTQGGARR